MAQLSQHKTREVASDIATLGTQYKVQIPKACIAILDWPMDKSMQLVAELLEAGRIRLHLASRMLSEIQARRAEIEQSNSPNKLDLLGTLDDRYRETTLYARGSEKSVKFEQRMVVYLGVLPTDDRTVFVEATKETVDVMSLTYRNRRLDSLRDTTSV